MTAVNARPNDKPFCPGCPECAGEGLTSRYATFVFREREVTGSVTAYCHRCEAGRWMERQHRENHPSMRRRIIDLQDPRYAPLLPEALRFSPSMRFAEQTYRRPESRCAEAASAMRRKQTVRGHDNPPPPGPDVATLPPPSRFDGMFTDL